jgi:hypothetical protein
MRKRLIVVLILLAGFSCRQLYAQSFSNFTGGAIPDNNTLTCYPVTVSGLPGAV